jgi:hypothetical protein
MIMETNIKGQLDRYKELAQIVCNNTNKTEKQASFVGLLSKINSLIPNAISSNLQAIQCYTKFYFQNYLTCQYQSFGDNIDDLIRFVNSNYTEIQSFENDSEDIRNERKLKSDQFRQVTMSKEEKIYANYMVQAEGASNYVRPISRTEPNLDWIYSQYGTYTQYLSFKSHRYFPISLNIKQSGCPDFETVNYLVLLYIAISNELCIINEELELLGIVQMPQKQTYPNVQNYQPMEAKTYFERRATDNNELKNAIPELLRVIEDLKGLRKSEKQTDNYINRWRKTKYKEYLNLPDGNGRIVECFNGSPDMTTHDNFINWLFYYFRKLYEEKAGKTITYAYALDILTVYYNQQLLNKRRFGKEVDRPNTKIDDVLDVIEAEEAQQAQILTSQPPTSEQPKVNSGKPQRTINEEKLKPYFKAQFKGLGNGNIDNFHWLIEHLQQDRTAKAFAQIALMIYKSSNALNNTKPNNFKAWYSVFCECVGCEQKTYQPKDLRNPPETLTKLFNYL